MIGLQGDMDALDALELSAADEELPAVYPNYIFTIDETGEEIEEAVSCRTVFEAEEVSNLDGEIYDDPYISLQWQNEWSGADKAWQLSNGSGITVAVLDTGIDLDHEDLMDNLVEGYDLINEGGNGDDDHGHGTHVAGIIAAVGGNGVGVAGIAPRAHLMPVKVMASDGKGSFDNIIIGMRYAMDSGQVQIMNLSLSSYYYSSLLEKQIEEAESAGILIISSAGNEGSDAPSYPAAFEETLSVAALSQDESAVYSKGANLASYSNYGDTISLGAPGSSLYSTIRGGGYGYMSGTSMASPVVAGAAALVLSGDESLQKLKPAKRVKALRKALLDTVCRVNFTYDGSEMVSAEKSIYGGIDAYEAVRGGLNDSMSSPVIAPAAYEDTGKKNVILTQDNPISIYSENKYDSIYYGIDVKNLNEETGTLYTGPFVPEISGKHIIKAISVAGGKRSRVSSICKNFVTQAERVSANDGRALNIVPGGRARLLLSAWPEYAKLPELSWESDSGISVKGKWVLCDRTVQPGMSVSLSGRDAEGRVWAVLSVNCISENNVPIALKCSGIKMSVVDTEYTKAAGLYKSMDVNDLIDTAALSENLVYESSKPGVVAVDSKGNMTAIKAGRANITIGINDGSGRKLRLKVVSVMPMYRINEIKTDTGCCSSEEVPLARRGRIRLSVYYNDDFSFSPLGSRLTQRATNKKLLWTSSDPAVTVKNGRVVCSPDAELGSLVKVTAYPADGFGESRSISFRIYAYPAGFYVDKTLGGSLSVGTGYKIDTLKQYTYVALETEGDLIYYSLKKPPANFSGAYKIESTRPEIMNDAGSLKKSTYGYYMVKPGSARLIVRLMDGSKKKAVLKVKAVN